MPAAAAALKAWLKSCALVCALLCGAALAVRAQPEPQVQADDQTPLVVDGDTCHDVIGMGRTVVIRGEIKHGVVALGGDVIVEGRVEGDVGTVGGSVVQKDGSYIGGDVWVLGGTYQQGQRASGRNPASSTIMIAGLETELRNLVRNPVSLLMPRWSLSAIGLRVLAVLFWFIVSLALTAATPGAISRAATRLRLTSLRVAVIGLLGACVISFGVPAASLVLPPVVGALLLALALLLLLVAYLFGRVAIHAATGRWLQRKFFAEQHRSESAALLLGTVCWVVVLSLPYVWVLGVAGLLVTSLGLALTARYRLGWRHAAKVD